MWNLLLCYKKVIAMVFILAALWIPKWSAANITLERSINNQSVNYNYLDFTNAAIYDTGSGALSFSVRICPRADNTGKIYLANGSYGNGGFYLQAHPDANHLYLVVNTTQQIQVNNLNPIIGTWFLLIVTKDTSGNWRFYKDGTELTYDFNSPVQSVTRGAGHLILGAYPGPSYITNMCITDFQWYNRLLTADEIANLATATPVMPTDIVSWWILQETTGTVLVDYMGTNNGTLYGTTTGCYSLEHPVVTYTERTTTYTPTYTPTITPTYTPTYTITPTYTPTPTVTSTPTPTVHITPIIYDPNRIILYDNKRRKLLLR